VNGRTRAGAGGVGAVIAFFSSPELRSTAQLPAGILSQVAYGAVFAIADSDWSNGTLGARAATITSLLMLGVPETRAIALVGDQP
jgi:hypothetical protein